LEQMLQATLNPEFWDRSFKPATAGWSRGVCWSTDLVIRLG
jgi:hypothetical protein